MLLSASGIVGPAFIRSAGGSYNTETIAPAVAAKAMRPGLHQALREATRATHERMHLHRGFLAVQDRSVTVAEYMALLARLYGFHRPFEIAAGIGTSRSDWLCDDLVALGAGRQAVSELPLCDNLPRLATANRQLGALYVIEGSALGGVGLAKRLDGLFPLAGAAGRRFLLGRGRETAPAWNSLLARLAVAEDDPSAQHEIVGAAVETFDAFEAWLGGWERIAHG